MFTGRGKRRSGCSVGLAMSTTTWFSHATTLVLGAELVHQLIRGGRAQSLAWWPWTFMPSGTRTRPFSQQGVNPKVVSERLGHAKVGTTLDIYSHVLPSMQEQAARGLDRAFRRAMVVTK